MHASLTNHPRLGRPRRSRALRVIGCIGLFAACGLWGQGQSEPASGFADSGTFALDTGGFNASGSPGTGVSSGFVLNTLGFTNPSTDLNQTGFASSGGFTLDTSNGTASPAGPQQTGFADSTGFSLDTRNPDPLANTGFADSGGFSLDTGGYDGSDHGWSHLVSLPASSLGHSMLKRLDKGSMEMVSLSRDR